jgi:dihydrolipoamide dehydrogenase
VVTDFDVIVLGAGSGGLTVAVGLARFGKRVALIERDAVGGDCTNAGCIPSKSLIHLVASDSALSPRAVLERVRAGRDRLRDEETAWVQGLEGLTLVRAAARFTSPHEVELKPEAGHEEHIRGRRIVVATGSRPSVISVDGLPAERILTNESLFELKDAPEHMAILGAGAIGCEMAFAFRRLGSRVTLVQRSERVLSRLEPEVGELIGQRLEREGVEVLVGARVDRFVEASRTLEVRQGAGAVRIDGVERVLMALGRRPNIDLDLEKAGVAVNPQGVTIDGTGRTNVRHIFAVGDVTPASGSTHAANALGRRVVRSIALRWLPAGRRPQIPAAVFTDPEVAHVGPPLAELRHRFPPELIRSVRIELADTDRGYTSGIEAGFVLLHALRLTGRVLSGTIVAPAAGEMIPLLTLAVQRRVTLWALSGLVFPYPVLSEALKKAADAFVFETLPRLPREVAAYARLRWRRRRPEPDRRSGAAHGAQVGPTVRSREG